MELTFLGDFTREFFEDLSIIFDAKILNEFSRFDNQRIDAEFLGMGSAKKVICNKFETHLTSKENKSPEHVKKIADHVTLLNEQLKSGILNRKNCDESFNF